jgi:hypothetical protein
MTAPNCPKHGNLVLELARGRLDDREAMRAEQARVGCGHCAGWWNRSFGDNSLSVIDTVVGDVFSGWAPPARRRQAWLAAAAAAVLAVGLGTATLMWRDGQVSRSGASAAATVGDVVSVMDFEEPMAHETITVADVASHEADEPDGEAAVFESGLETGDLSGWSTHS